MQDGDAEFAVGVDVGVVERVGELEFGRGIRVVGGELHVGEEVAAVVPGVGVDDDEGDLPVEDVVVFQLGCGQWNVLWLWTGESIRLTSTWTHFSFERTLNSFMRIRSAILISSSSYVFS